MHTTIALETFKRFSQPDSTLSNITDLSSGLHKARLDPTRSHMNYRSPPSLLRGDLYVGARQTRAVEKAVVLFFPLSLYIKRLSAGQLPRSPPLCSPQKNTHSKRPLAGDDSEDSRRMHMKAKTHLQVIKHLRWACWLNEGDVRRNAQPTLMPP